MDTELQLVVTKFTVIILGALIALIACCWIFDCLTNEDEPGSRRRDSIIGLSVSTLGNEVPVVSSQQSGINQMETGLVPVPLAVNVPIYGWQMKTMNNEVNSRDDPPPSYEECCKN